MRKQVYIVPEYSRCFGCGVLIHKPGGVYSIGIHPMNGCEHEGKEDSTAIAQLSDELPFMTIAVTSEDSDMCRRCGKHPHVELSEYFTKRFDEHGYSHPYKMCHRCINWILNLMERGY